MIHQPPIRDERLKEIVAMADSGVQLAVEFLHLLRAWEASQNALRETIEQESMAGKLGLFAQEYQSSGAADTMGYIEFLENELLLHNSPQYAESGQSGPSAKGKDKSHEKEVLQNPGLRRQAQQRRAWRMEPARQKRRWHMDTRRMDARDRRRARTLC